jgi:very-short-patch-repair endonuclease
MTESDLEDEFLRLCDRFGIPQPQVQTWIGPDRPDFIWPDLGLVVETDSWRWHGGRDRWEADQRKTLRLQRRGLTVIRFSRLRILRDQAKVTADLKAFIEAPYAAPRPV